jgi:hypothetical protein
MIANLKKKGGQKVEEAALPGIYVLQSLSGWTDARNGYMPYVVAAFYDWVLAVDPIARHPELGELERKLDLLAH